jgi:hypothetical protein
LFSCRKPIPAASLPVWFQRPVGGEATMEVLLAKAQKLALTLTKEHFPPFK